MNFLWRGLLLLCVFTTESAPATDLPREKNPPVSKLILDLKETKQSIVQEEIKQREIMSSLFEINKRLKSIVSKKSSMEQEKMYLQAQTKELAEKLLDVEDKLKNQKVLMRERLVAIYKLGGQGLARILFSSTNSAQLERNLKILGIVAKRDLSLIKSYVANTKELDRRKKKFTTRLAQLKKAEQNVKLQEKYLAEENKHKSILLEKIRKSKQFAIKKLNKIRSESAALVESDESGFYDLLLHRAFFEQQGYLNSPVQGSVTQGFGVIKDSDHNVSIPHKGIFIRTRIGTDVKSIFEGKVAFTGNIAGYGNTIILDHGDHYYSVYSHNSEICVKTGDAVTQSQIVAKSGRAENEFGDGLYFEIRHFSEPVDPKTWVRGIVL